MVSRYSDTLADFGFVSLLTRKFVYRQGHSPGLKGYTCMSRRLGRPVARTVLCAGGYIRWLSMHVQN